jgi:hypothetical protein
MALLLDKAGDPFSFPSYPLRFLETPSAVLELGCIDELIDSLSIEVE